jgi:hypothetical protein
MYSTISSSKKPHMACTEYCTVCPTENVYYSVNKQYMLPSTSHHGRTQTQRMVTGGHNESIYKGSQNYINKMIDY